MGNKQYTKEELDKYWLTRCPECGWKGLSIDCAGGNQIAGTGDYDDAVCPECVKKDKHILVEDID